MGKWLCADCGKSFSNRMVKQKVKLKKEVKIYYHNTCEDCTKERRKNYYNRYPHGWIRSKYNVSNEAALYWYKKSQTQCDICGKAWEGKDNLCIDHCHETGKIRGILCKHCNYVLGHSYDSIETLEKAIQYLKASKEN